VRDPGKKAVSNKSSGGIRINVGAEDTLTREEATTASKIEQRQASAPATKTAHGCA
jgi:hypothetical protein